MKLTTKERYQYVIQVPGKLYMQSLKFGHGVRDYHLSRNLSDAKKYSSVMEVFEEAAKIPGAEVLTLDILTMDTRRTLDANPTGTWQSNSAGTATGQQRDCAAGAGPESP